jgi:hypothetical protein
MKLDKHTLTEKKFYVAIKQMNELRDKQRNLPWRKLDVPYQEGWKINLVLRDDIARSAKAPVINDLLKRYANYEIVKNAKHISQIRRTPTLEALGKMFINKRYKMGYGAVRIKPILEKEYKQLPDTHKKYFDLCSPFMARFKYYGTPMYECNIPDFYFTIKTNKRMITQVQDIDPILKKQEAELRKILEPYWRTTSHGYGYYHYFENRKERRKEKVNLAKYDYEND